MAEPIEPDLSRREFLGVLGASAALAAGCSRPDRGEIVPFDKRPAGARPGNADLYASAFQEGLSAYGVLVKTREGRPIHVQGNDKHPSCAGKTSLRAMADIMGLYDPGRLRRPLVKGRPASWDQARGRLLSDLLGARAERRPVLLMTNALLSPTRRALVAALGKALPGLKHAVREPACGGAEAAALKACYGDARRPRLRLDRAKVMLALEVELLSGDRPEEIKGFAANRGEGSMSRLYAFEAGMSLTGANADHRVPWKPSRAAALGFALARALHQSGRPLPAGVADSVLAGFDLEALAKEQGADPALLRALAEDLKRAGSSALVVAGPALPPQAHAAAFLLNTMLGAEGSTVDASISPPAEELAGDEESSRFLLEAAQGRFAAAVFWGVNPAYAFPDAALWDSSAAAIPLKARIGRTLDETARACDIVLPEHHWLESWNDFEPSSDLLLLQQPAVAPLYDTRQGDDVLLDLLRGLGGGAPLDYRSYLMERWRREVQPASSLLPFERFWSSALHDGALRREAASRPPRRLDGAAVTKLARQTGAPAASGFELILSPGANVFDGRYADNGWLQELPDPVTKLSWGNAVCVSPADAVRLGLADGDIVELSAGGVEVELPAVVQPGQAPGTLGAALGYGRRAGSVAAGVGVNLFPMLAGSGAAGLLLPDTELQKTGCRTALPFIQRHHKMEGRDIARSITLAKSRQPRLTHSKDLATLYPPRKFPKHKWAMAVDLSLCTGCQACAVSCQSENNVPVVGAERVLEGREMHWLRVDRYYEGPAENPKVLLQPMMCQQCDDAPCETVCPVAATNHSDEGLNQMAYNRCVGTRYCANNCPYKVRRFNFFEYNAQTPESRRLAFNPEVTVRPRGVMEKCTFCVQRIQEAKAAARSAGRALRDGDIEPACAAACPAGAIVFGDLKDPASRVSRLAARGRGYRVLEELGVKPSVTYLADLSNPAGDRDAS
ncbi:MAG: 4Fe-4S dicluster domain-containing protein [Elusimicrobia bacterium]|nr:4Fe-4S dicluster domain-containing protein [Elusimicrobiota bacterium]